MWGEVEKIVGSVDIFFLDIYRKTIYYIGEQYIDDLYKEVRDGSG